MIIPSIDIMDGKAVQLRQGRDLVLDGGDPLERLDEMSVVGEVAIVDLDAALGRGSNSELIRAMIRRAPCRVGGGIRDLETARSWLDAGAVRIVLGTAAQPEILRQLPAERLIAAVDTSKGSVVVDGWTTSTGEDPIEVIGRLRSLVSGFLLTQVDREGCLGGFDESLVERAIAAARDARITAAGGITTGTEIGRLARLGADAQVGMALYTGRLSLGRAAAAVLEKGVGDRLWPTVVCDRAGRTLGLVWSSRESLAAAVEQRRGIYWSRSRNELWRKGATSGNTQRLLRVDLDCDRDALRFTVEQENGFCHTGGRCCWPEAFSLSVLERTLALRADESARQSADGSGTLALLRDPSLLEAKLVEEAVELARAEGRDEVIHEAADLVYFTLVAAARAGVDLPEIERELARRRLRVAGRPMIAKASAPAEAAR